MIPISVSSHGAAALISSGADGRADGPRHLVDDAIAFQRPKVMHVGRRLLYTHRKYTVTFNCPPDLREFPFDLQALKIVMQLKDKKFASRTSCACAPAPAPVIVHVHVHVPVLVCCPLASTLYRLARSVSFAGLHCHAADMCASASARATHLTAVHHIYIERWPKNPPYRVSKTRPSPRVVVLGSRRRYKRLRAVQPHSNHQHKRQATAWLLCPSWIRYVLILSPCSLFGGFILCQPHLRSMGI